VPLLPVAPRYGVSFLGSRLVFTDRNLICRLQVNALFQLSVGVETRIGDFTLNESSSMRRVHLAGNAVFRSGLSGTTLAWRRTMTKCSELVRLRDTIMTVHLYRILVVRIQRPRGRDEVETNCPRS
jgi:hypothetical protein